jgi:predicted 3-demethylubiquinone-9 3-methyltransferase (glyoxalase superfamily)
MKKVTPFLWYDNPQAEEAVNFYVSIFKNSKVLSINRKPDGEALTVSFELDGVEFMALNAGPMFKFTEAFSMYVNCEDQVEVDYFWSKLSAIPEAESCGWCKDKWGLSWQIIPKQLGDYISGPDPVKAERGMQAMLQMRKLIIADLKKAYDGE